VNTDLLPVPLTNSQPPALAVKRINWEKLDRVDENTVWAKVILTFVEYIIIIIVVIPQLRSAC